MSVDATSRVIAFRFGGFRLDRRGGGLARWHDAGAAEPVALGSRALDVLTVLVERRGELVAKQALMEAVWPGMAVEDSNLAVQISALRRILDEGRAEGSVIQTVIGRGYRFLAPVEMEETPPVDSGAASPESAKGSRIDPGPPSSMPAAVAPVGPARSARQHSLQLALAAAMALGGVVLGGPTVWRAAGTGWTAPVAAPRLSLAVLPFQNLSGDPGQDYLADGITDDLTTDLSHVPEAFVIARESAYTYKGKATDVRQIGRELGVRYVLEGSIRKVGAVLRVNAQLIAAETGQHLWSDRFEENLNDLADGQQHIVARMGGALGIGMVDIERARGQRERPANPDAFDLILRARALRNQPPTPERIADALAFYEQALLLDGDSALAMAGAAQLLNEQYMNVGHWTSAEARERAETLTARALAISPLSEDTLRAKGYLLRTQERWADAIAAAQQFIDMFPNSQTGYILLGLCKTYTGEAAEEIALNQKLLRLSPRNPNLFNFYRRMGYASLMLGRDQDAIAFSEQSLALHPEASPQIRHWTYTAIAAAHARLGHMDQAYRALAEAKRLWPFDTVRSETPTNPGNAVQDNQIKAFQDGLRRAGLRDHADEDADFGVSSDAHLYAETAGYTPLTVPGAATIRTGDLPGFIEERKPVIIDALLNFWGHSLPGAAGLKNGGVGGTLTDGIQDRLRRKMAELTGDDLSKSIVVVGWNAERFDGRNLTLRLVALGYTNVVWYRGGREAWEVAGLPETEVVVQDW